MNGAIGHPYGQIFFSDILVDLTFRSLGDEISLGSWPGYVNGDFHMQIARE